MVTNLKKIFLLKKIKGYICTTPQHTYVTTGKREIMVIPVNISLRVACESHIEHVNVRIMKKRLRK